MMSRCLRWGIALPLFCFVFSPLVGCSGSSDKPSNPGNGVTLVITSSKFVDGKDQPNGSETINNATTAQILEAFRKIDWANSDVRSTLTLNRADNTSLKFGRPAQAMLTPQFQATWFGKVDGALKLHVSPDLESTDQGVKLIEAFLATDPSMLNMVGWRVP